MSIGELLKNIRLKHSLTQTEIAELCLHSKDWCYLLEQNKLEPNSEDLATLGNKLEEPLLLYIALGKAICPFVEIKKA